MSLTNIMFSSEVHTQMNLYIYIYIQYIYTTELLQYMPETNAIL